jgi:glycosyltransferase involved in cell wall biosynthesis
MWAGEKIFYNAIINQINELGIKDDVYVKANIPENVLLYYYAISDIYVSPTIRDDPFLLMGTQDAMACGLPVIMTSSAPSITLMPNGYMVPKANPNGIANAVLKMCENQNYKAMGKLSQQLAKEYDIEVIAKKLIELCKKFECNLK